jgi:uncharacterized protein involved in outer membrane biogenesis
MSRRALIPVVLLALLAAAVAIAVTLHLVDLRGELAAHLSAATGRSVTLGGDVKLRLSLPPGLEVADVAAGPAEGSALRSVRVGRLGIVLRLWPMLWGEVDVHHFELEDGEIVIEPSAAAEGDAHPRSTEGKRRSPLLKGAELRHVKVEVRRDGGQTTTVSIKQLTLESEDGAQVFEVSAAGAVEQIDFDLSGHYDASSPRAGAADGASIEVRGQIAGAKVSGSGSVGEPDGTRFVELRVQATAPSLHVFAQAAARDLPELGPVRASALLTLHGDTIGVSDLDLTVGDRQHAWLELTGYAHNVTEQRDFLLKADFGVADVRALGPLVGNPPDIGRLAGKATVADLDGTPGVEEFTLQGGRPGVLEIGAKGRFDDIKGVHDLEAHVEIEARDLAVLAELFHTTLPPIGTVEFSAHVTGRAREVATDGFRLRLDRTHFQGSFAGLFPPDQRPHLTANVEVPVLYLDDIGIEPEHESEAPDGAGRGTAGSGERIFADTPLDLGWSKTADVQLTLHLAEIDGIDGEVLDDLRIEASLADGRLSARHVAVDVEGGNATAVLQIDSRTSPPTFTLEGTATGVNLGRIVEQIDGDKAYSGKLDAKLNLKTRGTSPHALASGLDGEVTLSCGAGTFATAHAGIMTRDLFQTIRRAIGKARPSEVLNCLVVDVAFRGGVGTANTLVLDAEDVVIVGEGSVDLGRETLDLRLVPTPRSASLISTAVTAKVTGPLTHPNVTTEKGTVVTSATKAIVKNIASASGIRLAWRKLSGKSEQPLCAELLASEP